MLGKAEEVVQSHDNSSVLVGSELAQRLFPSPRAIVLWEVAACSLSRGTDREDPRTDTL